MTTIADLTDQASGGLEAHVPKVFTPERPAVRFTRVDIAESIDHHYAGRQIPQYMENVPSQPLPDDIKQFQARPDLPGHLDGTYRSDDPQLHLHVTTFLDATVVSFTFPHATMDAFGIRDLLCNWSRVLAGRESEVTPLLGTRVDALLEAERSRSDLKAAQWGLESSRLQGLSQVGLYARLGWDTLTRSRLERRMLYIPREKLSRLVDETRLEIKLINEGSESRTSFVSEADVISAWVIQAIAKSDTASRPITAISALNARFRFPELTPKNGTYINNMVGAICVAFPPDITHRSLARLALEHREAVVAQSSVPQLLASLDETRKAVAAKKPSPPVTFGSIDSFHVVVNNLGKLDLLRCVDFGPAVVKTGDLTGNRPNPPGTVVFWYNAWHNAGPPLLASFFVYGRDWIGDGNYWCAATLRPETWRYLEKELDRL